MSLLDTMSTDSEPELTDLLGVAGAGSDAVMEPAVAHVEH